MATRLQKAADEVNEQARSQTAKVATTTTAQTTPTEPSKPKWEPRWVAIRDVDGSFAKFGNLTLTAQRECVKLDDERNPVAVDVVWGSVNVVTQNVSPDSTVWSVKTACRDIMREFGDMITSITPETIKDGSADTLVVGFGSNLVLRVFIGGINNTAIPPEVINQYGLVVFRTEEWLGGWIKDTTITANFREAVEWLKAKCPAPTNMEATNLDAPPF